MAVLRRLRRRLDAVHRIIVITGIYLFFIIYSLKSGANLQRIKCQIYLKKIVQVYDFEINVPKKY